MPEYQMKLKGWQVVVGVIILVAVMGVRLASVGDQVNDAELNEKLKLEIMTDYFPDDVAKLRVAVESGDRDLIDQVAGSITSSEMTITSVQTSYPLFSFTSSQKVVVKVAYSLDDENGNRKKAINYYYFNHGSIGNTWSYQYRANVVSYYLNFF